MRNIKGVSAIELAGILNNNLDFVLEQYVLNEYKICIKPLYKFETAYIATINPNEFILIYCEADDPEETFISINSESPEFENFCKYIITDYPYKNFIFHGEKNKFSEFPGEYKESFYFNEKIKKQTDLTLDFKLLTQGDNELTQSFNSDENSYFSALFGDFVQRKIYYDCGIIGAFNQNEFIGYCAYYEITKNIRDISYIYIDEKFRGIGCGKELLNFYINKNIEDNKISYYSYAENEISGQLVKSCGFSACAKRYETSS